MRPGPASLAIVLSLLGAASPAEADDASRRVVLTLAGSEPDVARMRETLQELTSRIRATADFERRNAVDPRDAVIPQPDAKAARVRAWVDLTDGRRATLYFVDERWERVLVRHVDLPAGFDEVAREQIGLIVHSTLHALLTGAKLGITRQEARDTLLSPSAPAEPPMPRPAEVARSQPAAQWDLWAAALYEGRLSLDGPTMAHGPGLSLFVSSGKTWRAGAWATVQYRWPSERRGQGAGVTLQEDAIRGLATIEWSPEPAVGLFGAAGPGVDLVHIAPTWSESVVAWPSPARWASFGLLRAALGARFQVARASCLHLAFGLDARSSATEYVAIWNGARQVVARQEAVQPFALIDFAVRFGGGGTD